MKNDDYKIFANNITNLRIAYGLTQAQFADLLDVNRASVGKWEEARALPRIAMLLHICDMFNIHLNSFMKMPYEVNNEAHFTLVNYLIDANINSRHFSKNGNN